MAMKFINKLYTKAIFSDASELNLTAYDMGESTCSITYNDEVVARLRTAVGTIGSMAIFTAVDVEVSIIKTSPAIDNYMNRIKNNAYIGGTLTLYDDINREYTIEDVSLNIKQVPNMNGTEAAVSFTISGNLWVNKEALGI